jgi:hypothetical protein
MVGGRVVVNPATGALSIPAMETVDERKARLAQALRDNLRRRKAQARAQAADAPPSPPEDREPPA